MALDAVLIEAEIEAMLMLRPTKKTEEEKALIDVEIEGLKMLLELCPKTSR